jgi:hypothetical protein
MASMQVVRPITVAPNRIRQLRSSAAVRMRPPSRLPTVYPTRSSYLQRLLWALRLSD